MLPSDMHLIGLYLQGLLSCSLVFSSLTFEVIIGLKENVSSFKVFLILSCFRADALMEYHIISAVSRTEPKQDSETEIKRTPHPMLPC